MGNQYRIGALIIAMDGDGPIYEQIEAEMSSLAKQPPVDRPHIRFRFVDELPSDRFRYSGDMAISENRTRIICNGFICDISYREQTLELELVAPYAQRHGMLGYELRRAKNWGYLHHGEECAKNFFYGIFDWVTQISQLSLGQTYIHASALEKDGEGLAILGWGGVGKTTTMLKMVLENGWKYLSDDLGTVNREGRVYRTPKRIQVYAYNTNGEPELLQRILKGRNPIDRLAWGIRHRLYGDKKVRRRISAEQLFGESWLADHAELKNAIFLEPTSYESWQSWETDAAEIASRMAPIVSHEIEPYGQIARESSAAAIEQFESVAAVEYKTKCIIEQALSDVECRILKVPRGPKPSDLRRHIEGLL